LLDLGAFTEDLTLALDRVAFARHLGVEPDEWQRRLLGSEADRVLLNCSRQSGKTTMVAIIALHRALYYPGSLVLCLAPALRQSQELFGKVLSFYRQIGRPVPADAEQHLGLELANGSRVVALPGTEKTIRGFSGVSLLVVDEAAQVDDALYYAVRPMLAVSGGKLMMLSTPFGRRGVFYESWENGEGWERYRVSADECPRISAEFLAEERLALGNWWYRQEYFCEFLDTLDQVFGGEVIDRAMAEEVAPLFEGGRLLWSKQRG
jgi:hypothetical protein